MTHDYTIFTPQGAVAELDQAVSLNMAIREAATHGERVTLQRGPQIMWASDDITRENYPLTETQAQSQLAKHAADAVELGYRITTETRHAFTVIRAGQTVSYAMNECSWRKGAWRVFAV